MQSLAVDFGTSNTVAALGADGGEPRLVTIDGSPLVPSSVFLTDDGTLAVGRDADRQARIDPSRYEPNPKRRIDDGELLLGAVALPVSRVVAAVFGRIADEVRRQLGGPPDQVRLTHPARWGRRRTETLLVAARDSGLVGAHSDPVLIPEPIAAATHFATLSGDGLPDGGELAVYDLGGGTVDVAVVRRKGNAYEVLAEAGLPDLGGLDLDQAIIEHIGASAAVDSDRDAWRALLHPVDAAGRRQQRTLATDVRDGKEALSRYAHTDIALPPPFPDVHLTRAEFEELIRPTLGRSIELLRRTVRNAGSDVGRLAGIYLVGGSSRVPLVARMIQEGLGVTPTTLDQPETSVATGALYLPLAPPRAPAAPVPPPAYRPPPVTTPPVRREQPPAPAPPARSRRRWPLAMAAGLLVVGGVVAIVLALVLSDGSGPAGGGDPPTTTGSGTVSSTSTGVCTGSFGHCIDDAQIREYVRPTYGDITACQKNVAFGASFPGLTGDERFVTCSFKGGYQVVFGEATGGVSAFRSIVTGALASSAGLRVDRTGTWKRGARTTFTRQDAGAGIYWDDTSTNVFALAVSEHGRPDDIQQWWQQKFDR